MSSNIDKHLNAVYGMGRSDVTLNVNDWEALGPNVKQAILSDLEALAEPISHTQDAIPMEAIRKYMLGDGE